MVIIKKRTLLRCCYNCRNVKKGSCDATPYGKTEVEATGICQYFIRKVDNDRADAPEVVQGQEPEEV